MDQPKYSALMEARQDLPDPRQARGKRFEWPFLLALIASALVSGQQTGSEIADWVALHASELIEQLKPRRGQVASGSTLRGVLQSLDIALLEQIVASRPRLTVPSRRRQARRCGVRRWTARRCVGRRRTARCSYQEVEEIAGWTVAQADSPGYNWAGRWPSAYAALAPQRHMRAPGCQGKVRSQGDLRRNNAGARSQQGYKL